MRNLGTKILSTYANLQPCILTNDLELSVFVERSHNLLCHHGGFLPITLALAIILQRFFLHCFPSGQWVLPPHFKDIRSKIRKLSHVLPIHFNLKNGLKALFLANQLSTIYPFKHWKHILLFIYQLKKGKDWVQSVFEFLSFT